MVCSYEEIIGPSCLVHRGKSKPEILTHLELVVNTVSMEEAAQQQQVAEA